ncbi:MAG TPA: hemin uptake protein HemP [Thiobacillus sp.]
MQTPPTHAAQPTDKPASTPRPTGVIATDALFNGNQEILISHNGEHYRLRITKNGKLILTK